jgi:hypothetical protein
MSSIPQRLFALIFNMAPNDSASMSFKDPLPADSSDHALIDPQPTEDAANSLYASPPPPFGHPLLEHFGFAKGYVNLNHGAHIQLLSRIVLT